MLGIDFFQKFFPMTHEQMEATGLSQSELDFLNEYKGSSPDQAVFYFPMYLKENKSPQKVYEVAYYESVLFRLRAELSMVAKPKSSSGSQLYLKLNPTLQTLNFSQFAPMGESPGTYAIYICQGQIQHELLNEVQQEIVETLSEGVVITKNNYIQEFGSAADVETLLSRGLILEA